MATLSDGGVDGHMPWRIFPVCSIFNQHGDSITCSFSNCRCYSADLKQGGLKILCKIKFLTSSSVEKEKAQKLVIAALSNFDGENFADSMQFC